MSNFAILLKVRVKDREEALNIASWLRPLGYNTTDNPAMLWIGSCGKQPTYLYTANLTYDVGTTSIYPGTGIVWARKAIEVDGDNKDLIVALAGQRKDGPYQPGEFLMVDWNGPDSCGTGRYRGIIRYLSGEGAERYNYSEGFLWTSVGQITKPESMSYMNDDKTKIRRATAEEIIEYYNRKQGRKMAPKENNMNETQRISRIDMGKIWEVACRDWKAKLKAWTEAAAGPFDKDITLSRDQVEEMFAAATEDQRPVLERYLSKPKPKQFTADMLNSGEVMLVENFIGGEHVHYLLRHFSGFVGWNSDGRYVGSWSNSSLPSVTGEKVDSGASIMFKAK